MSHSHIVLTIQEKLDSLLDRFQQGVLPFEKFSREFSETYTDNADQLPDEQTTQMYDAIHERLEWTTDSPPKEDRAWGWIDQSEFREWLTSVRKAGAGRLE